MKSLREIQKKLIAEINKRYPEVRQFLAEENFIMTSFNNFDFQKIYGDIAFNKQGEAYIEAHHLTPLSDLPEGKSIQYNINDDFRVLCANCHKMVHRKNPQYTIDELKKFMKK